MNPNISPNIIPPKLNVKNKYTTDCMFYIYPFTIIADIFNKIIHVPSFKRDSPSINELNFFGAPTSFFFFSFLRIKSYFFLYL
jgi:hypothetical protein